MSPSGRSRSHIATDRLALRPVARADVEGLHELWMDRDVRRYVWDGTIRPLAETAAIVDRSAALFAQRGFGLWVASARVDAKRTARGAEAAADRLVGFCGYWFFHDPPELELLYGLARDAWGRGLATEMARALLAHGFAELGFDEVQASTDAPNVASIRVMERLGMRFHRRADDAGRDTLFYRIRREAFCGAPAQ
ncbi:MAG TPA: GNAT family N-acetyltransferase [Candidatus Binatia bacterium]|nr:GNAT family N-acetyltransferase [Candidatus Binatia bacterium]